MLTITDAAPDFSVPGIHRDTVRNYSLRDVRGRWLALFFYPADFSFVCPTEVKGFSKLAPQFRDAGAEIYGVSVDSIDSHRAWIAELGGVDYPLLGDTERKICRAYHVLHPRDNVALRATFLIDPSGIIQYSSASSMNVGRNVEETLRVLKAVCTGKLCPVDWKPGDAGVEPGTRGY
jgi:peroxiredoxin (alkyl hydroperoxide reductase subunit C)